jgi:putative ABC transport system permease protein
MIASYFRIAFRNILKSKIFSAINLIGISVGMAASILILYFVLYETSFDKFHKNAERIYRVEVGTYRAGTLENESALTPPAVGKSLIDNFNEVEAFTRIASNPGKTIIIANDKSYREEKTYLADPSLLKVFDFELIQGNSDNMLSEPFNIGISEKLAEKIFGTNWQTESILNKAIDLRSDGLTGTFKISGVFKNLPNYSHFKPEILASKRYLAEIVGRLADDDNWEFNFFYTYIRLAPSAKPEVITDRFNSYVESSRKDVLKSENVKLDFQLQPVTDIHLKSQIQFELESNGDEKTVYALGVIGIITLIVAWINFINLSTARSIKRAKEVGVRKVLGASKTQLVGQFITEAILVNAMSLTIALLIIQSTKSFFGEISGVPLDFISLAVLTSNKELTYVAILIIVSGIILSGLYPAFVLSSFNPVKALKANLIRPSGISLRKALVVVQFAISIIMISATFIVFKQINFMRSTDLGVDIERTVVIEAPANYDQIADGAATAFKLSTKGLSFVKGFAMSSVVPGQEIFFRSYNLTNQRNNKQINCGIAGIDSDFLTDFKIGTVAGTTFASSSLDKDKVILNEEAIKQLGYNSPEDAIGNKLIHNGKRKEEFEIVGVVKNYHQRSLKSMFEPIMFLNGRDLQYYSVKLEPQGWQDIQNSIATLSEQFQNRFPGNPFNYRFLDQQFDSQYKTETKFSKVFLVFSIIAVIISSLGLIGLSTFMINLRNSEIGIRKVFGASSSSVTLLLIKDYFNLLLISVVFGLPIVWYFSNNWLTNYSYRIDLDPLTLFIPVIILTMTVILTIGFQSVYAASRNPIQSIKNE